MFIGPYFQIRVMNRHAVLLHYSLKTYGLIKGNKIHRIARCNPWFGYGGYDPVKKEKEAK